MSCVICHKAIASMNGLALPTTDGQWVHRACAEQEARVATRRRTRGATFSGLLLAGLLVVVVLSDLDLYQVGALVVLLALAHIRTNLRWWRHTVQPAWLWWRIGRYERWREQR